MSPPGSDEHTFWGVSFIFRNGRQDSLCQGHKGFVDVDLIFGRSLEELHAQAVGELLALLVRHLSLVFQVALVSDQNFNDVRTGVLSDLTEPSLDVLERLTVGNIID